MATAKADDASLKWETQDYMEQKQSHWPRSGRHILAQYNERVVVVYQAFCPEIAQHATTNQRFGGPKFSFNRMSWIKTNFLWMMYRSGWASKHGQEHVLAVWIKREGFDEILSKAYTPHTQKDMGISQDDVMVRLQWDPDHGPKEEKEKRRAIQLGLRGDMLRKYATEWVVKIEDITPSVLQQAQLLMNKGASDLQIAKERVYVIQDPNTAKLLGVDRPEDYIPGTGHATKIPLPKRNSKDDENATDVVS